MVAVIFAVTVISSIRVVIYCLLGLPHEVLSLWKCSVYHQGATCLGCVWTWFLTHGFPYPVILVIREQCPCMSWWVNDTLLAEQAAFPLSRSHHRAGCCMPPSRSLSRAALWCWKRKLLCGKAPLILYRYKCLVSLAIYQTALHISELILLKKALLNPHCCCPEMLNNCAPVPIAALPCTLPGFAIEKAHQQAEAGQRLSCFGLIP